MRNTDRSPFRPLIAGSFAVLMTTATHAEPAGPAMPVYFAGELDYARLERDTGHMLRNDTLSLALEGGVELSPAFAVGLRAGGWTITPYDFNRPGKGSSLSMLALALRYHARTLPRLHLRSHIGLIHYSDEAPGAMDGDGSGYSLGIGYDIPLTHTICITPFFDAGRGSFSTNASILGPASETRYTVASLGIEARYHRSKP